MIRPHPEHIWGEPWRFDRPLGYENPQLWNAGWNSCFFVDDPYYSVWQPTINQEAGRIASLLDSGQTSFATNELQNEMYWMRGDVYAQDELLSEVNAYDRKGVGADLYLNNWDPYRGTWDNIQIVPPAYGEPVYGQPVYGQPVYGQPVYGEPGHGNQVTAATCLRSARLRADLWATALLRWRALLPACIWRYCGNLR